MGNAGRENNWDVSRLLLVASGGDGDAQTQFVLGEALGRSTAVETCARDEADSRRVERADLVFVSETPGVDVGAQVKSLAAIQPQRPILVLLADSSRANIRKVLEAGADEVLFAPLRTGELNRALLRISDLRLEKRGSKGTVCTLNSFTGGAGVTTLAVGFATALQRMLGRRTVLVDLDVQSSGVAGALDIEPEQTMVHLSRASKLDSIELEASLSHHSSGVYLLAAPDQIDDGEIITPELTAGVITVLREMFDFVVIDGGRHLDERMLAVWENSDRLFYVLNQSVSSVRSLLRLRELLRRLEIKAPRPQLVLNRYRSDLGITPNQIVETLEQPLLFQIPWDEKAAHEYNHAGDLWQAATSSQLARALEKLACLVAGVDTAPSRRNGFLPLLRLIRGAG